MHVYNIWGEIESGSIGITLNITNPPFKWQMQFEDGTKGIASLYLNQTHNMLVVYESSHRVSNLADLIQSIKSVVQSLYDATLLHSGVAARIELTSIMTDENKFGNIRLNDVKSLITPNLLKLSLEDTTKCSIKSSIVRMSLADIRNALLNLNDFGMLCYRSLETIMQVYKDSDEEDSKKAWEKMRAELRFEKSYIQSIINLSIKNRHGSAVNTKPEDAKKMISRAVILLGRYCALRIMNKNIDSEPLLK